MELARPALTADRQACTRLLAQALEAARTMRGGAALVGQATPAALLARWMGRRRPNCGWGSTRAVVVGLAAATVCESPGGRRGLVECCYVETGARAVGVGSALLEAAVAWCEAQGGLEVDSLALPGDRATKQRLEAAGFSARLLTLSRPSG